MADREALLWRLVPGVRSHERGRFLFFLAVTGLIGLAQTIGFVGAEALFLARVGPQHLPAAFIAASALTVLASLGYAALVGQLRNDAVLVRVLLLAALLLGGLTLLAARAQLWTLPAALCLYFAAQAVLVNHFWTFVGDYFDTLASKRLFPLFTAGASLGGFVGGGLALGIARVAPPEALLGTWAAMLAVTALLVRGFQRTLRRWGPLELEEEDATSVVGIIGALRTLRRSSLGRWLVVSALGMVLALFVAQYLYSELFARAFPDAGTLAAFLAAYLTITNLVEIVVELWVVPRVIQRLGVPSANLIHPLLTLLSFGGLAANHALAPAIAARLNREMLENALAGPVRNLMHNALPLRVRGRVRAFLEGIVVYSGMSVAGLLLLLSGPRDPRWLCAAGAAMSLLYLVANVRVRREYLRALVTEIRAGRLDMAEVGDEIGRWEVERLAALWDGLLRGRERSSVEAALQLAPILAERDLLEPLLEEARSDDPEVRRVCVAALGGAPGERVQEALLRALEDESAEVRRAAVGALGQQLRRREAAPDTSTVEALRRRFADEDPRVRAEAAELAGREGLGVLESMAASHDAAWAEGALRCLPPSLLGVALARLEDADPAIRSAALDCVTRLARPLPLHPAHLERDLQHEDSRVRRAAAGALAALGDAEASTALARALADPSAEVRATAAAGLGGLGNAGVAAAREQLATGSERTVLAAIEALGRADTPAGRECLAAELRESARLAWRSLLALAWIPEEGPAPVRFLRVAHCDRIARRWRIAFALLEQIESPRVVRGVQKALRFATERGRGDALEVLSNLGDRHAAHLLVLMAEPGLLEEKLAQAATLLPVPRSLDDVLEQAQSSSDRWIRRAAIAIADGADSAGAREETMERLLILRRIPLFAHLSLEQLEAINRLMKEAPYASGEVVIREGDPGGRLYIVVEGRVRVVKGHGSERAMELAVRGPGDYFGEMAILDDQPRSATIVVTEDTRLLSLDGDRLKELILQMPEIAFEILRVLSSRIRSVEERLHGALPDRTPS